MSSLVDRLLEFANLTPPICRNDKPEVSEHLGERITIYCNPFQEVQGLCREAAAALQSVEQHRWVPVKERLPALIPCNAGTAYSEAVLVWTSGRKIMVAIWDGVDFCCDARYWDADGEEITHWMPLPELPKEE